MLVDGRNLDSRKLGVLYANLPVLMPALTDGCEGGITSGLAAEALLFMVLSSPPVDRAAVGPCLSTVIPERGDRDFSAPTPRSLPALPGKLVPGIYICAEPLGENRPGTGPICAAAVAFLDSGLPARPACRCAC